jgi:hypothetical protein
VLELQSELLPELQYQRVEKQKTLKIDIATISRAAFQHYLNNKNSETFVTSLYEINQIIKHKTEVSEEEQAKLCPAILEYYHDYLNMFSKEASNTLLLVWPYDHRIELTTESSTGYCLFYKMSLEELEAAKQYI